MGSSADKLLNVLGLYTVDRSVWSAEEAAAELGVSMSTAYRYFNALVARGLLDRVTRNRYVLGPAFIEFDFKIRSADPILKIAQPVMSDLLRNAGGNAAVLLCRLYRQRVMCIHQETSRPGEPISSYERGRPRPMVRGATSKIILAHLPPRALAGIWRDHRAEIAASGLGATLEEFRAALRLLRRNGFCVTRGEVDGGRIGIAAPIFDGNNRIVGSLSIVVLASETSDRVISRLAALVVAATREIVWTIKATPAAPAAAPGPAAKNKRRTA